MSLRLNSNLMEPTKMLKDNLNLNQLLTFRNTAKYIGMAVILAIRSMTMLGLAQMISAALVNLLKDACSMISRSFRQAVWYGMMVAISAHRSIKILDIFGNVETKNVEMIFNKNDA